jgi:hypothetical protein
MSLKPQKPWPITWCICICKEVEDPSARTGPISDGAKAAWRHVLARFPREIPRGGEFLIAGDDLGLSTKQYVRMLSLA